MSPAPSEVAELIRVRGLVQGVGFRPMVWRLANHYGLRGWVGNDGGGVTISVQGRSGKIEEFLTELQQGPPPLARIEAVERIRVEASSVEERFRIAVDAARLGVWHYELPERTLAWSAIARNVWVVTLPRSTSTRSGWSPPSAANLGPCSERRVFRREKR